MNIVLCSYSFVLNCASWSYPKIYIPFTDVKELSSPVDSMPVLLLWTALKERWKRNQKYVLLSNIVVFIHSMSIWFVIVIINTWGLYFYIEVITYNKWSYNWNGRTSGLVRLCCMSSPVLLWLIFSFISINRLRNIYRYS